MDDYHRKQRKRASEIGSLLLEFRNVVDKLGAKMADLAKYLRNIVSLFPAHIPVGGRFVSGVKHELWVEGVRKRLGKTAENLWGVIPQLLVSELVGGWDCLIVANGAFPLGENAFMSFGDKLGKSDANPLLVWSRSWWHDHC